MTYDEMIELNKIYNEDCLIGMQRIPDGSVDAIICDLPYGVLNKDSEGGSWDNVIPLEPLWEQYLRIIKCNGAIVLFCQGMFTAQLMMSQPKLWRYNLIWDKISRATGFLNANRMPLRVHEDLAVFYKHLPTYNPQMRKGFHNHTRGHGGGKLKNGCYGKFDPWAKSEVITDEKFPLSIISIAKEHDVKKQFHPTQKPVDLVRYLVRTYTNEGETVLDNCMGSGTTAVACVREKRNFIGFELNKEYYDIANKRIENEYMNQPTSKYYNMLTRAEEIKKAATEYADEFASENSAQYVDAVHGFITGAKWADEHPKSPWRPVAEMPADKWLWCMDKDKPESLPYIAKLDSESGQCFTLEDMELVFPDYWMPIPPLKI